MTPSPKAIALIKRFEGFAPTPYLCPAGRKTIGYGHVIRLNERFPPQGISESEAEILLIRDAGAAAEAVNRFISAPLSQCRFDALTSFVFNIGAGAFARSTLRRIINNGWHDEVPAQLMRWVNAGGRKLAGLEVRRAAEAQMYEGK